MINDAGNVFEEGMEGSWSYKHSAPLEPGGGRESYKHSAPLEPGRDRDGPTNIRLRWSREGIETVLQTFGTAGAGKGSRVLQTFGSAGAGKGSRRSYKHSAPLEPGRDRDGPTNIRHRWSREGIESPTNIRLRWSREGIETILRTFGSAGAGKGSRRSYKQS